MQNERRSARRANQEDNPRSRPLSVQLPRSRITGGGGLNGSPITPSTPPVGNHSNLFPRVNFSNFGSGDTTNTPPTTIGKRPTMAQIHENDDSPMRNRFSLDSVNSFMTNSTVTGDGHVDDAGHVWTDEQVAIIVRTLEEGAPPPKAELRNSAKYRHANHQLNPNSASSFKFLANWNAAPPPPTTPYSLPHVPPNLIDHWARLLKTDTDWPHDTRAIRGKLREMAEEVAKEDEELKLDPSPRKMPSRDRLDADSSIYTEQYDMAGNKVDLDYEDDDLIISPVQELPLPSGQRDDAGVYKSSLAFQRNEDNIEYQPFFPVHSASYYRARSPTRPHSPSPSEGRGDTISPTNSHFSFNSGDGISPTKPTFGITPEKPTAGGRYLSPSGFFRRLSTGQANRSRSISPSPTKSSRKQKTSLKGKDKPLPPVLQPVETPSLSPMQLSPHKDQGSMSVFASGSVRKIGMATPRTAMDPSDLMASIDGGQHGATRGQGAKSARRAPIPMPFFTRDTVQSQGENQGQGFTLASDPFFSAGEGDGDREPSTISSATGTNPYSSISSISSLFSQGSMRKVIGGISGKSSANDLSSGNTARGNANAHSNQPASTSAAVSTQHQPGSIRRDDPHAIQNANKNLMHIPSLPSLSLAHTHPHLVEERGHAGRSGIKRSASFSKPAEMIKRAPSYGGPKAQPTQQKLQPPEVPPKDPRRMKHKREHSGSSLEYGGSGTGTGSEYDTEDVPPSSAPSSDRITQVSPLKPGEAPVPNYAWDSSPSPEKLTGSVRRVASPTRMFGSSKLLASPSKLLASPTLLPSKFFGRKKIRPKLQDEGGSGSGSGSVSPGPASETSIPPISVVEDDAMDIDVDYHQTPAPPSHYNFGQVGMAISPTDTASPMGGITPRPRVMSTPRPQQLRRKVSSDWGVPDPVYERHASAELRSIRQSPIEERRDGEPRRKRVKTDELESPPPLVRGAMPYGTRASSESRYMSPRARSDGPVRTFYKRTAASKTPPRRTAGMPRSPRLLPGGGRTTPSRSPRSDMRPRLRSGDETPLATFSKATSATIMTPESDLKARISTTAAKGSTKKTPTHDLTAATISSASKARKPALDVNKPSTAGGKAATGSKRVPKREPSFFGAELPKPQTSGTTRFPTATTASISSVLFPGGVPHDVSGSTNDKMPTFGGVGSGEEGVIRAGESVASSRRAGDGVGKARSSLRNGLGGPGKSRMTRSISMLGPGDYQKPY